MAGPTPRKIGVSELKSKLMRPATTSHFICEFAPPSGEGFKSFIRDRKLLSGFVGADYGDRENQELIQLSCANAALPGSSLATHEINNDHTGVTERHVYRRQYDQRSEFTFYVDNEYRIIDFFENWMSYIVGEDEITDQSITQENRQYNYRVNYPDFYKTDSLYITKFEKDYNDSSLQGDDLNRILTYKFINAYPISVNSMPVSYEASEVLKCTVAFTYSRYVIMREYTGARKINLQRPNGQPPVPAIIQDGRPTLAQLAEQLEEAGGRGPNFGSNILR